MNTLSFLQIHCLFTNFYANSAWIYYLSHKFSMDPLSCSQIDFIFPVHFANSAQVNYLSRKYTICFSNSLFMHFLFYKFTMNALSISRIHYESAIFSENSRSYSRIIYINNIFLEWTWINYLYREFTMNSLSVSRIHYEFAIYFSNLALINLAISNTYSGNITTFTGINQPVERWTVVKNNIFYTKWITIAKYYWNVCESPYFSRVHHGQHCSFTNYHVVTISTMVEIIFLRKLTVY